MECNKDEAAKAKGVAEKKLAGKDINGAQKFAHKAQSLFPGLDGLQALLTTIKIYISAERKINGEVDWYGVLGVDPSSDDETIKKQYRKLALALHPDKNKSVGADGAFKILSEAWSLLSDKARKTAYDQKRRTSRGTYEKVVPTHHSKPAGKDSLHPSASNDKFNPMKNAPNPHLAPSAKSNTFWTVCTSCKMQFEYAMLYLNKQLQCYHCKKPFLAIPISAPQTNFQPPWAGHLPQSTPGHSGGVANVPPSTSAARRVNGTPLPHENLNRMHANAHGQKPRKRRRASLQTVDLAGTMKSDQASVRCEASGINGVQQKSAEAEKVTTVGSKWPASMRELSVLETRSMLMEKAKEEISNKLNEWKNITSKAKGLCKVDCPEEKVKTKVKASGKSNGEQVFGSNPDADAGSKFLDVNLKTFPLASSAVSETQTSENVADAMTVPDADFHDFDRDRTENSFRDNQVWAAYDNDDGMPRYYAMIHNVISRNPFKMRISWLNSKSTAEFSPMNWVGSGFYKTSGDFRVGKYELNKNVNSFSHIVKWTKGARGAIRICPTKGDVWALYRNWSSEWNEHTLDEEIHQYDMVEVLSDYNEEQGVIVIPLVKVAGFKTVFCQHMDKKQARVIPREEMFRFSHQVPSCLLTGQESPKAPKGCLELDPAAIPVELLQVIADANDQVSKDNSEREARDVPSDAKKSRVQESIQSEFAINETKIVGDGLRV